MSHINDGIDNELGLVVALNGKKIGELTKNLHFNIHEMFGYFDPELIIKAKLIDGFMKPDFEIEIGPMKHFVSVKSGRAKSVHQEDIFSFCKFLECQGISKETIESILLFHFGDNTLDGTGKKRMDYNEVMYTYKERIAKANLELNKNRDFIANVIKRCVFSGTNPENIDADYIYHGNVTYGVLVSSKQLYKYIMTKTNWNYLTNLHIGPLLLRPHARYVNMVETHPESRFKVECDWPNMDKDMYFISRRYDG